MTLEEQNKEVVRRWNEEVINGRKPELIDSGFLYENPGCRTKREPGLLTECRRNTPDIRLLKAGEIQPGCSR